MSDQETRGQARLGRDAALAELAVVPEHGRYRPDDLAIGGEAGAGRRGREAQRGLAGRGCGRPGQDLGLGVDGSRTPGVRGRLQRVIRGCWSVRAILAAVRPRLSAIDLA